MKKLTATAALGTALLGLSLTGCFKNENKSSVNADGTAKFTVVMELNLAPIMAMMGGGGAPGPSPLGDNHNILVQMVRAMNPSATGDIKKALASSPGMAEKAASLPDMKFINSTKDAGGNWIISMAGVDEVMGMFAALQAQAAKDDNFTPGQMTVTEEEVTAKIEEFRPAYAQYKPMAAMFLKDMSTSSTPRSSKKSRPTRCPSPSPASSSSTSWTVS